MANDVEGFTEIRYEAPAVRVARIVLARPDRRNAQDMKMLYEINRALDIAMHDDEVRVVIIAADGPHFSAGHFLGDDGKIGDFGPPVLGGGGYELPGPEGHVAKEQEFYLGFCWRWRNLPKPTIVQVQGKAIAGGLMLVWPFDLIVASDDAEFSDPVVAFGTNGHEFFVHAWELGHRKAKEMLFTGEAIGAEEARTLGMVNHVVPREQLDGFTLALAEKIAQRPTIGLKLAKMSVNQSLDAQGMWSAVQSAFTLHHLGHAHNQVVHGMIVDPEGAEIIRKQAKASKPKTAG
ncbi:MULTISPECIES: enoyl-CoA hydratase [unclassified Sphingomonas]|uniref:enoyl-CoA hydratase n=1 Tax=unclassified Sphingomonas TaxID=196159 RepID=UPI0006FD9162|nr:MULTISPECIES: enoyl-CoA hydratase [unclassified Sphingomonas]KQX18620.1 enoyl-CoA hydratase [Sphingomonas sp. Root1294]KQY72057.1 enoyl-CoA hydratase [Sphingomonas sp. Root50]KRB94674.1 enoyl-CoA hydratase [Sphingomonas sp. Root720]